MLCVTACLTGAMVMVIEILGARIIGPFFGVSLYVWTALISVTLLALALGYAAGGWRADRQPSAALLYGLIGLAGCWLILLPGFKAPVLEAAMPAGLRLGCFFAASLLFGIPLFLLGCVSPFLLRLAALDLTRIGRTAGLLYAVSTAGSFVGAAGTGFYLLGSFGVIATLRLSGATLVLLACAYFIRARPGKALLLAAGLVPLAWTPHAALEASTADGTRARIVWARDSFYGALKVVEYQGNGIRTRELTIDGLIQGGIDTQNGQSIYEYAYLLERLPLALRPDGGTALMIGLGTGVAARALAAHGLEVEVVEIDPQVHAAALQHFDFPPGIPVTIEDARTFLARGTKRYDYLLIDVFNGDTTPGYLLSREALRAAKARLSPGGVLAFNLMGSADPEEGMLPAVLATLAEQFRTVRVQPAGAKTDAAWGNYVVLASDGAADYVRTPDLRQIHPLAAEAETLLAAPALGIRHTKATPLTDDFNPLDLRDTRLKELVRRELLETTPASILHALPGNLG